MDGWGRATFVPDRHPLMAADKQTDWSPSARQLVSVSQAKRWKFGAQMLAWAQDVIHIEGPAHFVQICHATSLNLDHKDGLIRLLLAIFFLVVVPFFAPVMFVSTCMTFDFSEQQIGTSSNFLLEDVEIDMDRSRPAVYLRNQTFQGQLSTWRSQLGLGCATLVMFFILARMRLCFEKSKFFKQYVICGLLNFLWMSSDYPKLKFSSAKVFCIPFFKLVPCAWASVMISFIVVLPSLVLLEQRSAVACLRCVPAVAIGSFTFGKLYMQAAHATFDFWLSTPKVYSIVHSLYEESPLPSLVGKQMTVCAVSEEKFEQLSLDKLLETRFHSAALLDDGSSKGWFETNAALQTYMKESVDNETQETIKRFVQSCTMTEVYVLTQDDIQYKICLDSGKVEVLGKIGS